MFMYMCSYVYMHTHMCVCVHIHMHMYIYIYIDRYMCVYEYMDPVGVKIECSRSFWRQNQVFEVLWMSKSSKSIPKQ